jgi:hypothetical protein
MMNSRRWLTYLQLVQEQDEPQLPVGNELAKIHARV